MESEFESNMAALKHIENSLIEYQKWDEARGFVIRHLETSHGLTDKYQWTDKVFEISRKLLRPETGIIDKNGNMIRLNDQVRVTVDWSEDPIIGRVKYGEGTYDSGCYKFIGFYLKLQDGKTDSTAGYLLEKNIEKLFIKGVTGG